jgi:hypothetical protein
MRRGKPCRMWYWQTGHIDALWTKTIQDKQSMTGDVILPLMIDPRYTVDMTCHLIGVRQNGWSMNARDLSNGRSG